MRDSTSVCCRYCLFNSLFLDNHGERDLYMRRGKPLFINRARYERLQQLWLKMQVLSVACGLLAQGSGIKGGAEVGWRIWWA